MVETINTLDNAIVDFSPSHPFNGLEPRVSAMPLLKPDHKFQENGSFVTAPPETPSTGTTKPDKHAPTVEVHSFQTGYKKSDGLEPRITATSVLKPVFKDQDNQTVINVRPEATDTGTALSGFRPFPAEVYRFRWDWCQLLCSLCPKVFPCKELYAAHVDFEHKCNLNRAPFKEGSMIPKHRCLQCGSLVPFERRILELHFNLMHQMSLIQYENKFSTVLEKRFQTLDKLCTESNAFKENVTVGISPKLKEFHVLPAKRKPFQRKLVPRTVTAAPYSRNYRANHGVSFADNSTMNTSACQNIVLNNKSHGGSLVYKDQDNHTLASALPKTTSNGTTSPSFESSFPPEGYRFRWDQCQVLCSLCPQAFASIGLYTAHLDLVHKSNLYQAPFNKKSVIPKHTCLQCGSLVRFERRIMALHLHLLHHMSLVEYENKFSTILEKAFQSMNTFRIGSNYWKEIPSIERSHKLKESQVFLAERKHTSKPFTTAPYSRNTRFNQSGILRTTSLTATNAMNTTAFQTSVLNNQCQGSSLVDLGVPQMNIKENKQQTQGPSLTTVYSINAKGYKAGVLNYTSHGSSLVDSAVSQRTKLSNGQHTQHQQTQHQQAPQQPTQQIQNQQIQHQQTQHQQTQLQRTQHQQTQNQQTSLTTTCSMNTTAPHSGTSKNMAPVKFLLSSEAVPEVNAMPVHMRPINLVSSNKKATMVPEHTWFPPCEIDKVSQFL